MDQTQNLCLLFLEGKLLNIRSRVISDAWTLQCDFRARMTEKLWNQSWRLQGKMNVP